MNYQTWVITYLIAKDQEAVAKATAFLVYYIRKDMR